MEKIKVIDDNTRVQIVNIRIEKVEDIKEPYKYQVVIKDELQKR